MDFGIAGRTALLCGASKGLGCAQALVREGVNVLIVARGAEALQDAARSLQATVGFVQPDLSKTGGLSEPMRIAAMASAKKISVNPHTSATAINMACSIHFLCALDNPGYFEADVTALNLFRDQLSSVPPYELDEHGCVRPPTGQGTGLELDLDFIARYPLIDGPCYV